MAKQTPLALAIAAVLGLTPFTAQHVLAQQSDEGLIEEVIVTGSRISRNPESYLGGMAIATGESIEQVGSYSTLDALLKLPTII